jgi:hypothetical protein
MMDKWFISMEDAIKATEPLPKYEMDWETLLSDSSRDWKLSLLKGDHTLYDYDVMRCRLLLAETKEELVATEKLIIALTGQIAEKSAVKQVRPKKGGKFMQDPVPGLKEGLGTAVIERDALAGKIINVRRDLAKFTALQSVAVDHIRTTRKIFQMALLHNANGELDSEWIKKAVTWVGEQAALRMKVIV